MPTSKETLQALQEQLAAERLKKKNLEVLVLQNKPEAMKLDLEDLYALKEIKKTSEEIEKIQRENLNLETYVDYLKKEKAKKP